MKIAAIQPDMFAMIVEYGKRMKSTFTAVDSLNGRIFGFNAIANDDVRRYNLACLKFIDNIGVPDFTPVIMSDDGAVAVAAQTKDFTALAKQPGNTGADVYYDYLNGRIVPTFITRGEGSVPTFDIDYMRIVYMNITGYMNRTTPIVLDREITDDAVFNRICNMKADQGGTMYRVDRCTFFVIGNILGINKGDKVFVSIYPESISTAIVHFKIVKPKKKYTLNVMYRILQLSN